MANPKIKNLDDLEVAIGRLKADRKKVVHCHGVFDLVHPGHILHFQAARKLGDVLVVTITPDRFVNKGPGRPVFNERLRLETLAALADIDFVAVNEWPTAIDTIGKLKPDYYVKGNDYADSASDLTGNISLEEKAIHDVGGEIRFTDEESFSSSALINRFFNSHPAETKAYLTSFREKHSAAEVLNCLKAVSDVRVLVIGEAILDRYSYCHPLAKSPKEFIIATRFSSEENFAGGSLAIANHVAGFCAEVGLLTCLGDDNGDAEFCKSKLRPNIRVTAITSKKRPTIVKQRFVEPTFLSKLFEIQFLDDTPLPEELESKVAAALSDLLPKYDMVIAADFGHGLLTENIRSLLYSSKKFLAVNTQTNSANLGFNPITKYTRADYACIHEGELRLALHTQFGDFFEIGSRVQQKLGARKFVVTRGPNGAVIFSDNGSVHKSPALATKTIDRIGAGDAVFSITAPCAYKGYSSEIIGLVGNCAGALAVETVGNRSPVEPVALSKFISHLLK